MFKLNFVPVCPGFIFTLLVFAVLTNGDETGEDSGTSYCAFVDTKVRTERKNGELMVENVDRSNATLGGGGGYYPNETVQCEKGRNFCYTLWSIDLLNKNQTVVLMQGCWDHPDKEECPPSECVARVPPSQKNIRNSTRFCCCLGDMCNVNVTDAVNLTALALATVPPTVLSHNFDPFYRMRAVIISLASVFVCAVVLVTVFTVVRCCMSRDSHASDAEASMFLVGHAPKAGDGGSLQIDLEDLKIDSIISRGRYGEVYKGLLNDKAVAVKTLFVGHRQYYYNEIKIFSSPHMRHPAIVEFFGAKERPGGLDGPTQYLIVTAYMPLGSVSNYLKTNVVDWFTLCRMSHSVIAGLAHLHTEISDGEKLKPTIVHRDINTRNILVRADLTCCICDFGFAMKIMTSRTMDSASTVTDDAEEHASLADVGTLRYMAPEVLEGSVNLYDCKSSLRQVDIYAFGLVLWEMSMRCSDLYLGLPTPDYQLPFETEVGLHPSFEDMQVLVSRNKHRPAFPEAWKDASQAITSLRDTIEECWDQDAEARISAVCVEERIREISVVWELKQKHSEPTPILAHFKDRDSGAPTVLRTDSSSSQSDTTVETLTSVDEEARSRASLTVDENSVSTVTVETLMSPTTAICLPRASAGRCANQNPVTDRIVCASNEYLNCRAGGAGEQISGGVVSSEVIGDRRSGATKMSSRGNEERNMSLIGRQLKKIGRLALPMFASKDSKVSLGGSSEVNNEGFTPAVGSPMDCPPGEEGIVVSPVSAEGARQGHPVDV